MSDERNGFGDVPDVDWEEGAQSNDYVIPSPATACETCDDEHWIDEPTACGDPDCCDPMTPCPDCNPTGDKL